MLNPKERKEALKAMQKTSDNFYVAAVQTKNHPFIEFAGILNEYIKTCEEAHKQGIDFSECNTHAQQNLPMADFQINYINEKLECIFTGRSVMNPNTTKTSEKSKDSTKKAGILLESYVLEKAKSLCPDYPGIESAAPHEAFYAIESTLEGTLTANKKLHALIQTFRKKLGMSNSQVADLLTQPPKTPEPKETIPA